MFFITQQAWNYVRFLAQGTFFDAKPEVYLLPCRSWSNQQCWDGFGGFSALYVANSSVAYLATGACQRNSSLLFWNNLEDRTLIKTAIEAFRDGFADLIGVQCAANLTPSTTVENKLVGSVLADIKQDWSFELFDVDKIPEYAVFRKVAFRDGFARNPLLLTLKSCNSAINLVYHREGNDSVCIGIPSCFDVDPEGTSCPLCRDEKLKEDPAFAPDIIEGSTDYEEGLVQNFREKLNAFAAENERGDSRRQDTVHRGQLKSPDDSAPSSWTCRSLVCCIAIHEDRV